MESFSCNMPSNYCYDYFFSCKAFKNPADLLLCDIRSPNDMRGLETTLGALLCKQHVGSMRTIKEKQD